MTQADVDKIKANPESFKAIFEVSFAKAAGVNPDDVTITQIYVNGVKQLEEASARRLLEEIGSVRRLADQKVEVDYQVLQKADAAKKIDVSTITTESLKTAIEEAATEAGYRSQS